MSDTTAAHVSDLRNTLSRRIGRLRRIRHWRSILPTDGTSSSYRCASMDGRGRRPFCAVGPVLCSTSSSIVAPLSFSLFLYRCILTKRRSRHADGRRALESWWAILPPDSALHHPQTARRESGERACTDLFHAGRFIINTPTSRMRRRHGVRDVCKRCCIPRKRRGGGGSSGDRRWKSTSSRKPRYAHSTRDIA